MDKLLKAIELAEVAAENVKNAAWICFVDGKEDMSLEKGRELMDRLNWSEVQMARAERRILEAIAITKAREASIK